MVDGKPAESTDRVSLKKVSDTLWTFTIKGMVAGDCGTYTVSWGLGGLEGGWWGLQWLERGLVRVRVPGKGVRD